MSDSSTGEVRARETVVARLRPHARALIGPTILLVVVAAGFGYFAGSLPELWQNLALAGVAALIAVLGWLLPLAAWLACHYTVTTRRIVLRRGVFVRVRQEVLHSRAVEATVRTSGLQGLFGTGDVLVEVGQPEPVILHDLAKPALVQGALHDLIEANRRPRP